MSTKPYLVETVLVVSVLGTEPYTGGLDALNEATSNGDFSGHVRSESARMVADRAEQLRLCDEHGSDIGFFGEDFEEEA